MKPEQGNFHSEPAETFEADFMNARGIEIRRAMRDMGNFQFDSASGKGGEHPSEIIYTGSRGDGTKIEIKFIKGPNYKSPAQREAEVRAPDEKDRKRAQQIIGQMKAEGFLYASYNRSLHTMYFLKTEKEAFKGASIDQDFVLSDLVDALKNGEYVKVM